MFSRIVVGTDGSDTASSAVEHAAELAKAMSAELLVVHSYLPPKTDTGGPLGGTAYPAVDVGKSILADAEKRHSDGISMRTVMREGEPSDVIIDVAEEEAADLIIVGNRGMSGAKRFVLGSVPNRVSHHAPCAVLIVHTT